MKGLFTTSDHKQAFTVHCGRKTPRPFAMVAILANMLLCHASVLCIFSAKSNQIHLILLRLSNVEVPKALSYEAWWLKSWNLGCNDEVILLMMRPR